MKNNSSLILRALRKYFEITQVNFAALIGVSQSALSKIEAGALELSAYQWVVICEKFKIDPKSLFTGKIEQLGDSKVSLNDTFSVGSFKIPRQYSYLTGSTVRSAYPLLKYMNLKIGEKKSHEFLKHLGFDPDYFIVMNNPLNLIFTQDLMNFLSSEKVLNAREIPKIIETAKFSDIHSSILSELTHANTLALATKKLLQRVKSSYELNTSYEFVGESEYVVAKDQDHVGEFKLSAEFNKFRQIYNLSHFESLNNLVNPESKLCFQSKATSSGWIISKVS